MGLSLPGSTICRSVGGMWIPGRLQRRPEELKYECLKIIQLYGMVDVLETEKTPDVWPAYCFIEPSFSKSFVEDIESSSAEKAHKVS